LFDKLIPSSFSKRSAQGVTVVAAVAGTLMLTSKADDLKESQRRTALGELPPSVDFVPSGSSAAGKRTSDINLAAPSIQTSSSPTTSSTSTAAAAGASDETTAMTGKGRFARPMRVSQALEETEKLPGAHRAPIKVSEFAKRLERAEMLEGEAEKARAAKV
jgi:5-deoxy-D-glucuronate isomerase